MAGEELGLEDLVRVEHVVVDVDAVFVLEIGHHRGLDIVGPVVDVEDLLGYRSGGAMRRRVRASRAGGKHHRLGCAEAKGSGSADHDASILYSSGRALRRRRPQPIHSLQPACCEAGKGHALCPRARYRQWVGLRKGPQALSANQTFSSRCSRSQELITCRNTSYSASLTRVKASTNASPKSFTSGSLARSARKASSSERCRPNGRSCALPTIGSLGCTASTMPR